MNAVLDEKLHLPRSEVLKLAAVDSVFYGRQFFPKTFKQASPEFHRDYWAKMEDPDSDFFAAEMFRGAAKTTLARVAISKRIAYAVSRNILAIAISESMAILTLRWLKKAMENNTYWRETFGLRPGKKWADDWIEIYSEPYDTSVNILAKGMTAGLRGLNIDDYRPDFIYCDDICSEENTGTEEQRNKTSELFFGAVVPGLAPRSEAPLRKLVLTQTGLHKDDLINKAHRDPTFRTVKYPKLIENPDGSVRSAWPERWTTEECIKEKEDYTRRGQIHVYLREFACKIVSRETAPLQGTWLRYWTSLPTNLLYFVGLDPSASDRKTAHKTACVLIGVNPQTGDTYLVDYYAQRGKNPDEMWVWLLATYRQYRPRKIGTETIAFQKFLAWYFRQKMQEAKTFFPLTEVQDRRSKPDRIIQALSIASQGKLWVHQNHVEFVSGFIEWTEEVDWDLGDAAAQAITLANPWMAQGVGGEEGEDDPSLDEKDIPELEFEGGAP